jgi:hypothetical protein
MARPYHSASSYKTGADCPRAWFLRYVAGIREPDVTWAAIEAGAPHTSRQRATALGKAMHSVLESWYRGERPDWRSVPGRLALSGTHLLPHPTRLAEDAIVESAIGAEIIRYPIGKVPRDEQPTIGFRWNGVLWAGFRDLIAAPVPKEAVRLGLPDALGLFDYKSTTDADAWAPTVDQLGVDFQANLYALATLAEFGGTEITARWVYFDKNVARRSRPVDVVIHYDAAAAIVEKASAYCLELDSIRDEKDAAQNPEHCPKYGGCSHHTTNGGTCDARRSLGTLIQARVSKDSKKMAIDPATLAKFNATKAETAAATPDVAPGTPPEAAAPTAVKGPGRPRKVTTPAPAPVAPPVEPPPAAAAATQKTAVIKGANGPITITGDAGDVCDVLASLFAA